MGQARTRSRQLPPVLSTVGAFAALEALPMAVLILDLRGQIVHRNPAALELAQAVTKDRSAKILERLRESVGDVARHEHSFPAFKIVEVQDGGRHAEAEFWVNRLGDEGFIAYWRDITNEWDTRRATETVAEELETSAASFTAIGDTLAHDTGDVSASAGTVAAASEQMSASIREIAVSAAAAATETSAAVEAASIAGQRLAKLADSSIKISAVSNLITGIAEQTNLLALNATIEAARAGIAGKGFAVVATEVKELAGRTAKATGEIGDMISAIQEDSGGVDAAISEIVHLIGSIQQQQTTVAGAVEEQTATAQEISSGVKAVAGSAASSAAAAAELRRSAEFLAGKSTQLRAAFTR
jgi:Methyl-accepting chemotaxis protein (MCP) signalling domain/PAS domain